MNHTDSPGPKGAHPIPFARRPERTEGAGTHREPTMMPLFLKLEGRKVVLVGAGRVALGKLTQLEAAGADVTVIAPEVHPEIRARVASPSCSSLSPDPSPRNGGEGSRVRGAARLALFQRPFVAADLDGAWLAVAAATPEVNREVTLAADAKRIFVNAVDDLGASTAYMGAVLRRKGAVVAISTEGKTPALAALLREGLEALLPQDLRRWSSEARALRRRWLASGTSMARRRPLLLEALNRLYAP